MAKGFSMEAYIPNFYKNKADVFFVSKFLESDRASGVEYDKLEGLSRLLIAYRTKKTMSNISALKQKAGWLPCHQPK